MIITVYSHFPPLSIGNSKNTRNLSVPGMPDCRKIPSGFSDRFSQSAARTPCAPQAHNSHTCSLSCIFCQIHAPAENDFDFICRIRGKTLRDFFDTLQYAAPMERHIALHGAQKPGFTNKAFRTARRGHSRRISYKKFTESLRNLAGGY